MPLLGDAARPRWLRLLAAAASAPLGLGLYLSFSRGALFAWAAGLVALLVITARREQLRGLLVGLGAAVLAAAAAAPFKGVTALSGSPATQSNRAPREKLRYSPMPRGALAAAAASRSSIGRMASPSIRAHRTSPSAASSPVAFQ